LAWLSPELMWGNQNCLLDRLDRGKHLVHRVHHPHHNLAAAGDSHYLCWQIEWGNHLANRESNRHQHLGSQRSARGDTGKYRQDQTNHPHQNPLAERLVSGRGRPADPQHLRKHLQAMSRE